MPVKKQASNLSAIILSNPKSEKKIVSMPDTARKLVVLDQAGLDTASEFLLGVKSLRAEVDDAYDEIIKSAHQAHKTACAKKKVYEAPLIEAENVVKALMSTYLRKQEQLRIEEEGRVRRENERLIREQAEADNLARAQELSDAGDLEGAAAAVDAEVEIPDMPVYVAPTVKKMEGIGSRKTYKSRVDDLMALVKAVASGIAPIESLESNDVFLNTQARAYKDRVGASGQAALYPGVSIVEELGISAERGR